MERYASRLLVLGMLDSRGPMHGHSLRREVELRDVKDWTGIRPGSLYGMMHRLASEGLIKPLRTEREGQRPERTVYALTDEGRTELGILLDSALSGVVYELGVFDVAMLVSGGSMSNAELMERVRQRSERASTELRGLVDDRSRMEASGQLGPMERLIMRHAEFRLRGELGWHEEILETLREGVPSPSANAADRGT